MRWRYVGKHEAKRERRLRFRLLIPVLAVFLLAGSVVAYLSASADEVSNTLQVEQSEDPEIVETFENNEKTNVTVNVGNTGYAVYVRAAVVVTWKDEYGHVMAMAPVAGTDYTIDYGTDWLLGGDGFYYYKYPVPDESTTNTTSNLIDLCKPKEGRAPEGFGLNVEIIAQTIQALGTTDAGDMPAVTDAWGVTLDGSTITAFP